jgi:hypothetical protein
MVRKMSEVKYEHPLEYYTLDNFIEESRKLIGKPVQGIVDPPKDDSADLGYISSYSMSLGDDNPLFSSVLYALKTKYGITIAPPTFPAVIRYPMRCALRWSLPTCGIRSCV